MRFDPKSNPPSFASEDQVGWTKTPHPVSLYKDFQLTEKNTKVRLIVGVDSTEIVSNPATVSSGVDTDHTIQFVIGAIKGDHLDMTE